MPTNNTSNTTSTDLTSLIQEQANTAASTSVDGLSVSNRSMSDLIAAAKYLKSQQASKSKLGGVRMFKLKSNN